MHGLRKEGEGMSICYLLDGVTPPARQNGKSLPCERLQAENDKLREQGERLFDKTLELATENGKLRELVRGLWYCTENENKAMCEGCPLGIVDGDRLALACEKLMCELGVEI